MTAKEHILAIEVAEQMVGRETTPTQIMLRQLLIEAIETYLNKERERA